MQVVSVLNVPLRARVRLQTGLFIVVGATLALGSLAGCASSPESMAEHRGYEYQYALAERFRLGEGVEQDSAKAAYWYYQAATGPSFSAGRVGHNGARMKLAQAYREVTASRRTSARLSTGTSWLWTGTIQQR